MKLKEIKIEPGMVICTYNKCYIVFPTKNSNYPLAFALLNGSGWTPSIEENTITRIYGPMKGTDPYSGEKLWDEKSIVELSMEEIAKKFGISIEQLRIIP